MNLNDPHLPSPLADERILETVRKQQRWLRALTVLAVMFWGLAVIGGVGLLVCYSVLYAPKEKQIMSDYEKFGYLSRYTNSPTGSQPAGPASPEQALGLHFTMNYAATKGILAVVITVIVLSCGTLTTLLLGILNRRVTLRQINHSLAQISEQLKQLQAQRIG